MSDAPPRRETPAWSRGHDRPLEYHRHLLDDVVRVDAYERALRALVRPGDVVLDLGTGTGILAMLAARRGAARVHAVESMSVAGLARRLVAHNGLADRVSVHHADAAALPPVEPVDLLVTECMGRFLIDDGMLPLLPAAARWLKPGGRCCPSRVDLRLAPVGDVHLRAVDFFDERFLGLDLSPARAHALNHAYHARVDPARLMAPSQRYHRLDLPRAPDPFDRRLRFTLTREGRLQGLLGWFVAWLTDDLRLDTGPGHATHWGQYLFPLPPTLARAGDTLAVRLWLDEDDETQTWRWRADLRRGDEVLFDVTLSTAQRLDEDP